MDATILDHYLECSLFAYTGAYRQTLVASLPESAIDFPARAWLDIRAGQEDATRFYNGKPERGAIDSHLVEIS